MHGGTIVGRLVLNVKRRISIQIANTVKTTIALSTTTSPNIQHIKAVIHHKTRWPQLLTFEFS